MDRDTASLYTNGDTITGEYAIDMPDYKSNGKLVGNLTKEGEILAGAWTEDGEGIYTADQYASLKEEHANPEEVIYVNFTKSADGKTYLME